MNIKIQRFPKGHLLYSEAKDSKGLQAIFGQMVSENGEFICYTMERKDTLIPQGRYTATYYNSPANNSIVPLLHNVPDFTFIEVHVANWPHELKGCTAVGLGINIQTPQLISSGKAFNKLMSFLNMKPVLFIYETLV